MSKKKPVAKDAKVPKKSTEAEKLENCKKEISSLKKILIDTNVAIVAPYPQDPPKNGIAVNAFTQQLCAHAIDHVCRRDGVLVLDDEDEIFLEYQKNFKIDWSLGAAPQTNIASLFIKWVQDNKQNRQKIELIKITKFGDSYSEFPSDEALAAFDRSDRKFVAVANAHPDKPTILEATDSKWWGWNASLKKAGINVYFVGDYAEMKYQEDQEKLKRR